MKIRFRIKHPSGYLLLQGLRLTIRDWPCLAWTWAISVPFCLYAASPLWRVGGHWIESRRFANGIAPWLDARIGAAETRASGLHGIAERLTWASIRSVPLRSDWVHFAHRVPKGMWYAISLEIAALFFLVAGTLHVYLATEPPRLSRLFQYSAKSILGFLRAFFLGSLIAVPPLAGLILALHALLVHWTRTLPAHATLVYSDIGAAVLLLAALALLLFVDLVETHAMRRRIRGHSEVRRSLLPALRLLIHQFFWISPTFLLPYAVAIGSLVASAWLWRSLLLTNRPWMAYFAFQIGLVLLLSVRFWQRGMEVALIVAVEWSNTVATVLSEAHAQLPQASANSENSTQASPKQANPTLQELVQKLKQEPWAKTDVPPLKTLFPEVPRQPKLRPANPLPSSAPPPPATGSSPVPPTPIVMDAPTKDAPKADPQPTRPAQTSLLAEHAKKTPLVEATSEAPATEPAAKPASEEEKAESKPSSPSPSSPKANKI